MSEQASINNESAIILCGGQINYSHLPISTNQSNSMIPVNGKPVIGWILDDLLKKGIKRVTVVVRKQNYRLQNFVQRAYSGRIEIVLALLSQEGSIIQSLNAGLLQTPTDGLVRIVLGDTLITDSYEGDDNFVYVGKVHDCRLWCLVVTGTDNRVIDYIDKQDIESGAYLAVAGYYHLQHGDHLRLCVQKSLDNGEVELSHVLRRYCAVYPIFARTVKQWHDFGHIDNLIDARGKLIQSRDFNSLNVNPILNTITKVSKKDDKLRDELAWYRSIPNALKMLTPRIYDHRETEDHLEIVQEYYGYPSLAELYVYGDVPGDIWISILRHVLMIHQEFRRYPDQLSSEDIQAMYVDKTLDRFSMLYQQNSGWRSILEMEEIIFNGRRLQNMKALEGLIRSKGKALAQNVEVCIIHGDFCFSNILFDINNRIARLIDPRGCFGSKGIYGDPRYDMAKLHHSVNGLYDYIVFDMFNLVEEEQKFVGEVYTNSTVAFVKNAFDRMLLDSGYDLDEIKFIEGLLFVSMVPFHYDNRSRQQMMYLTGLKLLNETLSIGE